MDDREADLARLRVILRTIADLSDEAAEITQRARERLVADERPPAPGISPRAFYR